MLDCDCVDKDTKDIFNDINHSLTQLFGDINLMLNGQCTDSGGGRTKHALAQEIEAAGMKKEHYLLSTCTLHNLQTAL